MNVLAIGCDFIAGERYSIFFFENFAARFPEKQSEEG